LRIDFEWDPAKAASNAAKHGISFQEAMTVFLDQFARTILDPDHITAEERRVTMGEAATGNLLGTAGDSERGAAIPRGRNAMNSDDIRDEYDFSKGERGKFYRPNVTLAPPIHLDPEVLAFLTARAQARGVTLSELVNALLKKDIELIEAAE
jgi:Ribonuclease toxin, BrnT, of type II toxin-antitoxin system